MLQHSAFRGGGVFRGIIVITRVLVDFDSWWASVIFFHFDALKACAKMASIWGEFRIIETLLGYVKTPSKYVIY